MTIAQFVQARSQIPILGSIPLLGHLFKKTGTSKTRAELLVFVTPKIIKDTLSLSTP